MVKYAVVPMTALTIALVSLIVLGHWSQDVPAQAPTALIDPRITEVLTAEGQANVFISLNDLDLPMSQWTPQLTRQDAIERQARVMSQLMPDDILVTRDFEGAPAIAGSLMRSGLDKLASDPDVAAIALDAPGEWHLVESSPLIFANFVHLFGIDGTGVKVAVLDSGIDTDHPDLSDSIVGEKCLSGFGVNCGPAAHPAEDFVGHGTEMSGIITSNGAVAPPGIAPGAGILAYKVGNTPGPIPSAVEAALFDLRMTGAPVDFINMSFELTAPLPGVCSALFPAIETAINELLLFDDVLSFASTGNGGIKSGIAFPACQTSVVSVGAVYDANIGQVTFPGICADLVTSADQVPCFSNSSSALDLLAPGCAIITTELGGGASVPPGICGTSPAVPHAVGVAALLKQAIPQLSASQIRDRLEATGTLVVDPTNLVTRPRVDARVALLTDDSADTDLDGCTNAHEYGSDPARGGVRNPLDFWDFFDPTRDKSVANADFLAILRHFNTNGVPPAITKAVVNAPEPPSGTYWVLADRGGQISGANPWDQLPANGAIGFPDFLAVLPQFGHTCAGAPS